MVVATDSSSSDGGGGGGSRLICGHGEHCARRRVAAAKRFVTSLAKYWCLVAQNGCASENLDGSCVICHELWTHEHPCEDVSGASDDGEGSGRWDWHAWDGGRMGWWEWHAWDGERRGWRGRWEWQRGWWDGEQGGWWDWQHGIGYPP